MGLLIVEKYVQCTKLLLRMFNVFCVRLLASTFEVVFLFRCWAKV